MFLVQFALEFVKGEWLYTEDLLFVFCQ